MKIRKYITPIVLFLILALSVVFAFIYRNWISMFVASEMILFHFLPPFVIPFSVIAYKTKSPFWFKQSKFDKWFYKKIKIREWKNKVPSYDDSLFSLKMRSKEQIIKGMIQSGNVHLFLIFLSFVPIILGKYFSHYTEMIIMAVIFSIVHIPFVVIQRFNIPRVVNCH